MGNCFNDLLFKSKPEPESEYQVLLSSCDSGSGIGHHLLLE